MTVMGNVCRAELANANLLGALAPVQTSSTIYPIHWISKGFTSPDFSQPGNISTGAPEEHSIRQKYSGQRRQTKQLAKIDSSSRKPGL